MTPLCKKLLIKYSGQLISAGLLEEILLQGRMEGLKEAKRITYKVGEELVSREERHVGAYVSRNKIMERIEELK